MAELKTKPTKASVSGFLNKVSDKDRREDCLKVLETHERRDRRRT